MNHDKEFNCLDVINKKLEILYLEELSYIVKNGGKLYSVHDNNISSYDFMKFQRFMNNNVMTHSQLCDLHNFQESQKQKLQNCDSFESVVVLSMYEKNICDKWLT